jgi:hypothetical protein
MVMKCCIPKRRIRIFKDVRQEGELRTKTSPDIWMHLRERKNMFIKNNIPGDIDTSFGGI